MKNFQELIDNKYKDQQREEFVYKPDDQSTFIDPSGRKKGIFVVISYFTITFFIAGIFYVIFNAIALNKFNDVSKEVDMFTSAYTNFFTYLVLILVFVLIYFKDLKRIFKDFTNKLGLNLGFAVGGWCIMFFIMLILGTILTIVGLKDQSLNQQAIEETMEKYYFLMIPVTCLFAPIVEELLFRKAIFDMFGKKLVVLAIIVSSFIFGAIHLQEVFLYLILGQMQDYTQLLYIFIYGGMGLCLALIYYYSKNIYVTIITHMIQNIFSMLMFYLAL